MGKFLKQSDRDQLSLQCSMDLQDLKTYNALCIKRTASLIPESKKALQQRGFTWLCGYGDRDLLHCSRKPL